MTPISPFVFAVRTPSSPKREWMRLCTVTMIHGMNQSLMMEFTERNVKGKMPEIRSEVEQLSFLSRGFTIMKRIYYICVYREIGSLKILIETNS